MFKIFRRKEVLTAKTHMGLYHNINQDCVLALNHPLSSHIKLLAIADGMGGLYKSEIASNYVIDNLKEFFVNCPLEQLNNTYNLCGILNNYICMINNELYKEFEGHPKCGTTLTCAIVNKQDTIVANVGDSRTYAIIKDKLVQLTKDDSHIWELYERGIISKDQIRFHVLNNILSKFMGMALNIDPSIYVVKNTLYNYLLLFSDGITDCLSEKKIKYIIDNMPAEKIADELIYQAIHRRQKDNVPAGPAFNDICNGKDDSSVIVYKR